MSMNCPGPGCEYVFVSADLRTVARTAARANLSLREWFWVEYPCARPGTVRVFEILTPAAQEQFAPLRDFERGS